MSHRYFFEDGMRSREENSSLFGVLGRKTCDIHQKHDTAGMSHRYFFEDGMRSREENSSLFGVLGRKTCDIHQKHDTAGMSHRFFFEDGMRSRETGWSLECGTSSMKHFTFYCIPLSDGAVQHSFSEWNH